MPPTALALARGEAFVGVGHQLVSAARVRSDAMSILYRDTRTGRRADEDVRTVLDALSALKIRALGDRVSRATAWKVASELGWEDTAFAEYVAVAVLQADALVTLDPELTRAAEGRIAVATLDDLGRAG